jgi:hypothetical protein
MYIFTAWLLDYANPNTSNVSFYFTNPVSREIFLENRRMRARGLPAPSTVSGSGLIQPPSPIFKSTSDVSYCFAHVPEIFFSHDFSLKHTSIFAEPVVSDTYHDASGDDNDDDKGIMERMISSQKAAGRSGSKSTSGSRSSALYTVDLDDDEEEDMDDITDREGSNSSPDIRADSSRKEGKIIAGAFKKQVKPYKGLFNMDTAHVLTSYLDMVEVALLRQIITRSPSFFRALDDINCLHSYVSRAAIRVIHIRRQLRQTKDGEVAGDIRIPKLELRRKNEVTLNEKLQSIQR